MSFIDSILISMFIVALVFTVLTSLYFLIQLFSKTLGSLQFSSAAKSAQTLQTQAVAQPAVPAPTAMGPDLSTGELRLKGVDEKTAAMIMAIVSDESSIPLSELRFKSIRAIEEC